MKKFLFLIVAIVLCATPTYAAEKCVSESDYITLDGQIKGMSFGISAEQKAALNLELKACRAQVDKANDEMCEDQAPRHGEGKYDPKEEGLCKFTCDAGYYMTKGGDCNAQYQEPKKEPRKEEPKPVIEVPVYTPPVIVDAPLIVPETVQVPVQDEVQVEATTTVEAAVVPEAPRLSFWQKVVAWFSATFGF